MPLTLAPKGEKLIITHIGGNAELHLADLGFTAGGTISVIAAVNGDLIVNVRETRVAISRNMASKIMV